jgi:hypothetical protein
LTSARCCDYSYMCSWWWVELPPETCRATSLQKYNNLHIVASRWTVMHIANIFVYFTTKRQRYVNEYETFYARLNFAIHSSAVKLDNLLVSSLNQTFILFVPELWDYWDYLRCQHQWVWQTLLTFRRMTCCQRVFSYGIIFSFKVYRFICFWFCWLIRDNRK